MSNADEHPLDELINLTPALRKKAIANIASGREVTFHRPGREGATPVPFTIRSEDGGFKVRAADGTHIGSYADFTTAWLAGRSFEKKGQARMIGHDRWGKDLPRTMALLRR